MRQSLLDMYGKALDKDTLHEEVKSYFESFDRLDTFEHTLDVVSQVRTLAKTMDFDEDKCVVAAYLHDLGRVVKNEDQVNFCKNFGHIALKGEEEVPALLHQIASKIIACEIFGVKDQEVLSAVECHTTLKKHPNLTEKILFLADKISWREAIHQPLIKEINKSLESSLDAGIYKYFQQMHKERHKLKCYHKWSQEAYGYFKGKLDE